ncbi:MAG: DegT/DnrJ/EryC1/StrS aminotransferase family protein, partial [Candidatus Levybacteria bacterium]|nr:DegT/DnrJ/EryC1/StrS aminotransferase family protein [Candidatus Levybacteria bacterium]
MPIFNSLGSNYNATYVLKALFSIGSRKDIKNLKNLLEEKYQGKPILFYKGREALTFALKILNLPKKSEVAINGFTCVAVFNAIRYAGFEPLCLDLEETGGLNFTPESLENALKSNKNIKVVIVQNTLGFPCDIEKIEKLCRNHKLILIEDLAHCAGTVYKDGREAGTVGDFVALSFSQDKIIDAVSGGALIVRNRKFTNAESSGAIVRHPEGVVFKDRFYPLETYKIRFTYM